MLILVSILFFVSLLSKKQKLYLIKYSFLFVASIVMLASRLGLRAARPFELPLKWLSHYISGSGEALEVPLEQVAEAKQALLRVLTEKAWRYEEIYGKYHCLYHSTLYEGRGFYGRPTLFYLVGGFTFLFRRDGLVSGKDRYDWHPNENGEYFTSPFGNSKFAVFAMALLDLIFGNDWFVVKGFPCGESGISNKLWDDLHLVGAAPFWSYFDQYEIFTEEDFDIIFLSKDYSTIIPCDGVTARMIDPNCGIHRRYYILNDGDYSIGFD